MNRLKRTATLLTLLGLMLMSKAWGQDNGSSAVALITPEGIFDIIYDKDGNQYNLSDLEIITPSSPLKNIKPLSVSSTTCSGGYFNLYFEIGSGMDGSSAIEIARRNVICQLFSDISTFINSPLTSSGGKVNIWIRDIGHTGVSNPSTSGVLGAATSFYAVPSATASGIADNLVWQTIISGKDAYTNVTPPVVTQSGSFGNFFHGMATFNFANLGYNWHTDLTTSTVAGNYDLYSIALHEVTHALGFTSLINQNGQSKFGNVSNYYSRYDLFLKNHATTQSLITNTGSCSLYNFGFNASLNPNVVQGGSTNTGTCNPINTTNCLQSITYVGGVTQAVHTPTCYSSGSSLGHFEDECQVPVSYTVTPSNDMYFVMSNANGTGLTFMKRYLKPEERTVLCDLGYNVNTTYGSTGNLSYYNYGGSACSGIQVAGINDGITNTSTFSFIGNVNTNINVTGLLANDYNAVSFECLQDVTYGSVGLSATSGINSTIITFSSSVSGTHLLRYIPVSSSGKRGNITYVYVYVQSANCVPTTCQMINNGGFENSLTCGQMGASNPVYADCWTEYSCTPNIFKRNCTSGWSGSYNITSSNDSWNGIPNNTYMHLASITYTAMGFYESLQTTLNAPLVQNGVYTISFRAKGSITSNTLTIAASPTLLTPLGTVAFATATPTTVTSLIKIPFVGDNTWKYYSATFTYTGSTALNNLIILNTSNLGNTIQASTNVYIDDVSIVPSNQAYSLNLPSKLCLNQTITDLRDYLSPYVPNGTVFSGTGVSLSGGIYSFNPSVAGVGNFVINAVITNTATSCASNTSGTLSVVNGSFVLTAIANQTTVCTGSSSTLTANGGVSYTWQPGNVSINPLTVTPTVTTLYLVNGTNSLGCKATQSLVINVIPAPILAITPTISVICVGQTLTLTALGATSYTWLPSTVSNSLVVSPTATTVYTVIGVNSCGVTAIKTKTITVITNPPTTSITTPTIPSLCLATGTNSIVTLTASPTPTDATITWIATAGTLTIPASQYTITGNSISYNLSAYTAYTVPINFCATASSGGCSTSTCTMVYPCCPTTTATAKYSNRTFTVTETISTATVVFGGTITVNSGVLLELSGNNVFIDPNTKFVLNGNASFRAVNTNMHGCQAMWDGIYANNNSSVRISKSVVSDALSAVNDPIGGANVILTGNYFNKNQQSINFSAAKTSSSVVILNNNLFTCSNLTLTASSPWFTTQPNLTNAPTLGSYSITTMLPPYAGKHSYVGIYMQSATHTGQVNNAITIGGASNGTENVFDKLKIGILNFGSNSLIQNNVFQNLRNTTNNSTTNNSFTYGMYGVGVFINNFFGPTTLTNTIGGSLAQKNTFIDDEYGVYNQFGTALNIAFNRFETQDNGIRIGEHSMNKIVNITSNKFINNIRGINLLNNSSVSGITASITANVLENPTAQGTAADNFAIRTTEMSVASASINAGAKYSLYNNYVYGYYNGIYSAFTYSNSIKDNEVHMIQSGGGFQFGITTNRTGESEVANNVVDMQSLNAGAWYQAGYFVDNTMAPHIHCNNVNNLYNGFGVNYLNYCTPGNGFYGNLMQNAVNGFQLNANGEIGNQYYLNTSNSADNAWFNCTTQTSAGSGCNASGAKFYTRPTSPYNITLAGGTGVLLIGTNNSAASTQTCYASITTPTLNLKIGGAFGKALMQDQADEIADGTINFGANDANTKHIARKKLYYHTMLRNIDPNVTPSMANFMNGHRNQAVGKFWIIDSLINTGDSVKWNMAKALNNTVNANNDAEETQQAFNSQYITYLQNKRQLSVIEISSLESMASKCPIEYGDAVVQARTLLFNITYKQYYNTCEFEQPTGTKFKIAQTVADGSNIVLYPNPNDGKFVFESNDDLSYDLEVYNLLGEKILQQTVANKYEINLDNIAFSTYIVRMSRNGEQIKTIRICIIK